MNLKVLSAIFIPSFIILSTLDFKEALAEESSALSALALVLPSSGVKIVPRSQLELSDEDLEKGAKEELQRHQLGYVKDNSARATELLNFQAYSDHQLKIFSKNNSLTGTHLRPHASDIKLAFSYTKLPIEDVTKYFSASPGGGYRKEGWTEVTQFFYRRNIGTCAFTESNAHVTQNIVELAMESVSYDINAKPTLIDIRGNPETGFTYSVQWFDENYFRELECASKSLSKVLRSDVVALAARIDGNE